MLHSGGVDETLFVQILHAYSARNPMELILDEAYDACLARMGGDADEASEEGQLSYAGAELQHRFGANLFVREDDAGQRRLVAGSKKRNVELIPLRRVFATLEELATTCQQNATQLKHAVKAKVLGIPEEIVQEYCDMALSAVGMDDPQLPRERDDIKKCSTCGLMKSYKCFTKHKDKPMGLRSRCKVCESKARQDKKEKEPEEPIYAVVEGKPVGKKKKKKDPHVGLTGTAICAACGERKAVYEFDKARQKPFTLKCRECTEVGAPLMNKLCCSCHMELPLDHFYRDSYTKAGFRPRCMECMKARRGLMVELPVIEEGSETGILMGDELEDSLGQMVTSKRTRSRRRRRKSQKTRDADSVMLDEEVAETSEGRKNVSRDKKSKRSRRVAEDVGEVEDTSRAHAKVGALSSLSVRSTEGRRGHESSERQIEKTVKPRGLTGCSTVKDKQGNVTKYCTGCLHFKKASEFGRDVSKPSGLRSRCRHCQKRGRDAVNGVPEEKATTEVVRKKIPRKPVHKKSAILEKVCSRCDHQKPVSEFYRDKSKEDSYASICKKCAKEAKNRSEKANEKRPANAFTKARQGRAQEVDETDMELVLNYVDALLPESSAESADPGDEEEPVEQLNSVPHRICVGCKVDKSCVEFDANPLLPDGLCPLCKNCRRGMGMAGRRLNPRPPKRCCLRCGKAKTAIQFAKSIFFPNRTSRVCQQCRDEDETFDEVVESPVAKRRRLDPDCNDAVDLMDFECDMLRVRDPGGGEQLWNPIGAGSDSEERERPVVASNRPFTSESILNTQLRMDGPKSVTITHRVPAGCDVRQSPVTNGEQSNGTLWNGYRMKRTKTAHLMEKQCKRCGEMKTRDCYYIDETQPSHLSTICIQCCPEAELKA